MWQPDVLGDPWEQLTLDLIPDAFPPTLATLTRFGAPRHDRAVLYVHGFVDHVFQTHLAQAWAAAGWDFYGIDLRRYGRSLRPEHVASRTQNYTPDIAAHREELDRAYARILSDDGHTHRSVVLLGHSTGGLISALWANANPGKLEGLILNSPWLDLNESLFARTVGTALVCGLAKVAPQQRVGSLAPHYGEALHGDTGGEWDFDLSWKPHEGFPVYAGWLASIRREQRRVARGLEIDCPVLVCTSATSGSHKTRHDDLLTTDSVLRVEDMVRLAPRLGADVTCQQFAGGAHDLALSPEPARSEYLTAITDWAGEVADYSPS